MSSTIRPQRRSQSVETSNTQTSGATLSLSSGATLSTGIFNNELCLVLLNVA